MPLIIMTHYTVQLTLKQGLRLLGTTGTSAILCFVYPTQSHVLYAAATPLQVALVSVHLAVQQLAAVICESLAEPG